MNFMGVVRAQYGYQILLDGIVNIKLIDYMRGKGETKAPSKISLPIETSGSITDYQYNHNGTQLAVADSDGFISIYSRNGEHFQKISQFKGDEAAIWKVSWGDPTYGEIIAFGSFKKKVAIFQNKNSTWSEIAFHELHQGSVNFVEWASPAFGLKLFSAGSDGSIAILELKKNNWATTSFSAHQCSINSLSLRPLALNEEEEERPNAYPMLATVAKDHVVKIWRHTSEIKQELLEKDARIYQQVASYKPHTDTIRSLLWKKRWTEADPIEYQLLTASEDGAVKLTTFKGDQLSQTIQICKYDDPVYRLSQSLTGNLISVSVEDESERTFVYAEKESWRNWFLVEQIQ